MQLEGNKRYLLDSYYLILYYYTSSTKMRRILTTSLDSTEAKCRIDDQKVAGSIPASEAPFER